MNRRDLFKLFGAAVAAPVVAKAFPVEPHGLSVGEMQEFAAPLRGVFCNNALLCEISGPLVIKLAPDAERAERWKRFIATLQEPKDLSFDVTFTPMNDLE
jgi:hypothetical protein